MIILASTSPRRKQLLKQLGLKFTVVPSNVEEKLNPRYKPQHQAEVLSRQKAEAVAEKCPKDLIIAADTLVTVENEVIGKPKDEKDARRMLKKLSGRTHSVFTGFTIIDMASKKSITSSVETKVTFKKFSPEEIRNYIAKEKPFDNAGAYQIQALGAVFIEKIEGDYFNVVGLPLFAIATALRKFKIEIL